MFDVVIKYQLCTTNSKHAPTCYTEVCLEVNQVTLTSEG